MDKYDSKQMRDGQGDNKMALKQEKMKRKGNDHGVHSKGNEFFPQREIKHNFPGVNEIGKVDYPDQAEDLIAEQVGNVKYAKGAKVKKYERR